MTTQDPVSTVINCISLKASPSSHSGHICQAVSSLISVGTDVSVVSSTGESIPANRSLLSLASPFLRHLLASVSCCTSPTILLPDCSTHALRHLISIISNGFTTSQFGNGIFKDINEVMDTAKLLNIAIAHLSYEMGPALSENEGINKDEHENMDIKEEVLDEISIDQQMPVYIERCDADLINEENILASSGKANPDYPFPCLSKIPNNQESPSNISSVSDAKFSQKKTHQKHMATLASKDLFSKTTFNFHKLSHGPMPLPKSSITGDSKVYSCPVCPSTYTRQHNLNQHMNLHTGLSPYKCLTCGKAFKTRLMKNNHISKCVEGKDVGNKSKNENTETSRGEMEYDHIVIEGTPIVDLLEPKNINKELSENVEEVIGKTLQINLSCNVCQKRFTTENCLELHIIKGCKKCYKCPLCPTKFEHSGNIKRHVKNKHPEENFVTANQSQDAFDIKETANDLLLIHECKYCSKAFMKKKSLKTHTKNKHPDEKFAATNESQDGINNAREKSNNIQLNYQCKYCSKSFLKEKSLKIHIKSCKENVCEKNIEKEDPIKSIEKAGDSTSKFKVEDFDFKCDDCGKLFSVYEALMKHLAHGICFKFQCEVCIEMFKKKEDLDFHVENNHFASDVELY